MRSGFLMLLAGLAVSSGVDAQMPSGTPYLAVQGQAEERFVPDVFPLAITILETSDDAAKTHPRVEALAKQVLEAASRAGISSNDVQVGNLRVSPRFERNASSNDNVFLGNQYERRFELRLRSLDALREILALLPQSEAIRIQTQPFERSDAAAIRARLRIQAVADARRQAQGLAEASGVKLGRLLNVSDRPQAFNYASSSYAGYSDGLNFNGSASNSTQAMVVLREGQITLKADAYLVYQMLD
jgi:uncharacterized protein